MQCCRDHWKNIIYIESWSNPPTDADLLAGGLHVWFVPLDFPAVQILDMRRHLSPDEQQRADRFHFTRDKNHYIGARSSLRLILGRYLDYSPNELHFVYNEFGKPRLSNSVHTDGIQFNLSHTHGVALYAFSRGAAVGVDIEKIRPLPDRDQVAARFFSDREQKQLLALPAHQRDEAFFNCWTRKEAFIKAIGDGLSYPLDQFDVSLTPGEPARLLHIRGDEKEPARWSLISLTPQAGYVGALVVERRDWQLTCFTLPGLAWFND